jgi:citrate synthase
MALKRETRRAALFLQAQVCSRASKIRFDTFDARNNASILGANISGRDARDGIDLACAEVMLIGKRGAGTTAVSAATADRVTVRGRDLASDLMGRLSFTEYFYFLATGRAPTPDQSFFLDLSLLAIAEHGLTPSVQAARMTYAADPAALQGAVAAGILGCGTVILGAADLCRQLLDDVLARAKEAVSIEAAALAVAQDYRAAGKSIPGFGHPLHKPKDPRAERMLALARERGVAGRCVEAATRLGKAVAEVWAKPLPMNVSMAIAATLYDLDVPASLIRGVPILARTAGLIAHLDEEAHTPIGFLLASKGEEAISHVATPPGEDT